MKQSIIVNNVCKNFKTVNALKNISFSVNQGELFGLIGPDGAGKTTLFRIIATLLLADTGTVTADSLDVVKDYKSIRNRIGYMPGQFSLYRDMTVEENLSFFAAVFGTTIEENYELVADIYKMLEPFKNRRAANLSGGMKQKLALCCTLIHRPSVLLLDEPTTGVDPVSRREFWDMLYRLREHNITVLVSTPYMDEAAMCDRVALIRNGKIMNVDTPQNIVNSFTDKLWKIKSDNMYHLLLDTRKDADVKSCFPFGESHHVIFKSANADIDKFKQYLLEKGHRNIVINSIKANIEDYYMNLSHQQ